MEILYRVHNNLYVNLTNQCPCACVFCLRKTMDHFGSSNRLWLEHEPTWEEIEEAFTKKQVEDYEEVVFCGFGEPMMAFEMLKKTAAYVKERWNKPIRINTNGLGNLIWERDITPELQGLVDTVSISLNTPDARRYQELVQSKFGEGSFEAMLAFAKSCTKYVPNVVMTTVATTLTPEEEEKCQRICDEIGARYRIRPWED